MFVMFFGNCALFLSSVLVFDVTVVNSSASVGWINLYLYIIAGRRTLFIRYIVIWSVICFRASTLINWSVNSVIIDR